MRLSTLLGPDLKATLVSDPTELVEALEEFHPEDIAELLEDLPEEVSTSLVRALPDEFAARVLERVSDETRSRFFTAVPAEEASTLLAEMAADDRVDAIQALNEDVAEKILEQIAKDEPELAEEVRALGAYGEATAGGLMTTEYVSLPPDMKVWQAIEEVRRATTTHKKEFISYVYICGFGRKVLGVVSLRELILADPSQALADVMKENVVRLLPTLPQEEVAQNIAKYDLSAMPVVDENGRLLGVVTIDDVVDVVIDEATEDVQRLGAVVPIEHGYFETGFVTFVRSRAAWLIVLFIGGLLTATVMRTFEGAMARMVSLVIFVPLIISAGGNAGSQSSTLIIRGLAVGEIVPRNWVRVLAREAAIGIALGAILGVVGFARVLLGEGFDALLLSATVSLSVVAVVIVGAAVGSMMPLLIKRIGFDPAISSTPFIASLVDVLGLVVYFGIARIVMNP